MKTYYISRKTCRDFSVFLTLQTICKEQKKGAEEEKWGEKRRDKWTKGKQSAVRVFGEHTLRPKGAERSIFWAEDANTRPDLCCRLGKVNHLHCSRVSTANTHAANNLCSLCASVWTEYINALCAASLHAQITTCLCSETRLTIYLTYAFITDEPKTPRGIWRSLTEQLMRRLGSDLQSLQFMWNPTPLSPRTIPHISLLFPPLLCCIILCSSALHPERSAANKLTSSIPNQPACHRSMLILLYPLVRRVDLWLTPSLTRQ